MISRESPNHETRHRAGAGDCVRHAALDAGAARDGADRVRRAGGAGVSYASERECSRKGLYELPLDGAWIEPSGRRPLASLI